MPIHRPTTDHFGHHSWQEMAVDWVLQDDDQPPPTDFRDAIGQADGDGLSELVDRLSEPLLEPTGELPRLRWLLQLVAARVLQLRTGQSAPLSAGPLSELSAMVAPEQLSQLASQLVTTSSAAAAHCLQILAAQADAESLQVLAEFLTRQELADEQSVLLALTPLFQWPPTGLAGFFAAIGEDVWHWQLLGGLLDLAGHGVRKGVLRVHPLAKDAARLRELLSSTTSRLSRLEANPAHFGDDVATIQRVLNHAISLTVALCDTLGLIGDQQAAAALKEAMELSHRRIQSEAAGALARLSQPDGLVRLKQLVQDPASRLRALAYLDELNIDDQSLDDWRQPVALAEAEVVCWLADPQRFGVPPADLTLLDERTQYWPSYESPLPCFLFRFTYHFGQGDLSNLIIAGPLVHAFQADLRQLPLDDVYAMFAGWQAEHDEIYEVPRQQFNAAQLQEAARLLQAVDDDRVENLQPLALTFFFGERAVLASGQVEGRSVCIVADSLELLTMPCDGRPASLTPDLVLALYRGRKLLRSFNP